MTITRITFSPQTADVGYPGKVAVALMAAQLDVAGTLWGALWGARIQFFQTMLEARCRPMETVHQAAIRQG